MSCPVVTTEVLSSTKVPLSGSWWSAGTVLQSGLSVDQFYPRFVFSDQLLPVAFSADMLFFLMTLNPSSALVPF